MSATVGPDDAAYCIWALPTDLPAPGIGDVDDDDEDEDEEPYGAATTPSQAVLTTHTPSLKRVTRVSGVLPSYPTLQPLPDQRLLWVGARAEWRAKDVERNALVFGDSGSLELAECVGDGINHVRTSASGQVWMGFSDEGVYGNMGWGDPGPAPLGQTGLVRYAADLQLAWDFPEEGPAVIDDCYALNVADEEVWAYYYSDFPIVRITADGVVTSWHTYVEGADALIATGDRAALVGGYEKEHDRVVLGRLDGEFSQFAKTKIVMPDGRPLPRGAVVQGRGEHLHVFVGDTWLRADLSDFVA